MVPDKDWCRVKYSGKQRFFEQMHPFIEHQCLSGLVFEIVKVYVQGCIIKCTYPSDEARTVKM